MVVGIQDFAIGENSIHRNCPNFVNLDSISLFIRRIAPSQRTTTYYD
jgi:hypothetical protein